MIRLIAAIDNQQGIAKYGNIPWKIPTDERYFTEQTKKCGGVTLSGRVTFDTFKRPLIGRRNYVLSRTSIKAAGVETIDDINAFLDDHADVWIIGGASVFQESIARADELYLTIVDAIFGCDRFFPAHKTDFVPVSRGKRQVENGYHFRFEVWRRKS